MQFPRWTIAVACAITLGACELTDVSVAPSEDVLVVEAVLRTDRYPQQVLLHRTVQGAEVGPVPGAIVEVTGGDGTRTVFEEGGECYRIDRRYLESDSLSFRGTCYTATAALPGWVVPGETYTLLVRTPDGREVRGRTTVPGYFRFRSPAVRPFEPPDGDPVCSILPNTQLPIVWGSSQGAWSYVAQLRITGLRNALEPQGIGAPEPLELRGLAVSASDTTILLPSQFGVFERFQLDQDLLVAIQDGFPNDVQMDLVVAAADRNWVNGVRGGNFNPSGPVRVSSVVGDGVGVFGSLVARRASIFVRQTTTLPRCVR